MAHKKRVKRYLTRRVKLLLRYLFGLRRITSKVSYYPELPHKSRFRIFREQCGHIMRYGELNQYYYLYGLDVKGTTFKGKDLLAYKDFMDWRNLHNRPTHPFNYICLLRDKKLFSIVCEYYGVPCAKDIGILQPKEALVIMNNDYTEELFHLLERETQIFCKPIDAECGAGIFCLGYEGGVYSLNDEEASREEIEKVLHSCTGRYLVQRRLVQHPEMSRIYDGSINTIRLVTIRNQHTGEIEFFHSLLRVGTNGNVVDNWAQGGICVGMNEEGVLRSEGFYKPPYGLRATVHPNSGVVFEGFQIPFYREAVELCKSFHHKIDFIPAIGWDVAITSEGPCLVEANDNWEVSLHQIYGGLKSHFDELLKD